MRPPPVFVFMVMESLIQAIVLVWLKIVSPGDMSTATVCIVVPWIS